LTVPGAPACRTCGGRGDDDRGGIRGTRVGDHADGQPAIAARGARGAEGEIRASVRRGQDICGESYPSSMRC
jgi:hypothetical protein